MASASLLVSPVHRSTSSLLMTKNDSPRQSFLSTNSTSVASYKTAPLSAASRTSLALSTSSNHSSVHTVRDSNPINPIYALASQLKVTNDSVQIEPGPVPDSMYLEKIGKSVFRAIQPDHDYAGPPPPSPLASIAQRDNESANTIIDGAAVSEALATPPPLVEPLSMTGRRSPSPSNVVVFVPQLPVPEKLQRSSTDTKASYNPRNTIINSYFPTTTTNTEASSSKTNGHPTLSAPGKPTRRNTTGSTPHPGSSKRAPHHSHGKGVSQPTDDIGDGTGEIASDIELHAERIRRERQSKRAKQQQAAEAALTRAESNKDHHPAVEDAPLVGNLIGEGHVNYVLMYNMLTGIRIGVSRCQAKIKRPLTDEDFAARHKFSFDIVGNELTPSAKYDFKFKDYAPWVFRYIREEIFHLDPADYLLSLTAKYILSELGSPGKSGSFFYFSRDYRFIIKTIRHSEHKFLLNILKRYYEHIKENPHTLLSRFYGLHRVKLPRGRKIHFVIMNNLFPAHKDIHETYDLKGSTVGREYPEEKAAQNPRAVLKDLNWINRGKMLELGPEKRAFLTEQLRRDEEFLKSVQVMDYSLLVGIHNMQRGNKENLRRNTLKVFSPNLPETQSRRYGKSPQQTGSKSPEALAMKRAIWRSSDPKRLGTGPDSIYLPEEDTGEGQPFLFYQDDGGLRATDDNNDPMNTIYYLGVIDILTPFGCVKRVESLWKGLSADRHKISPVPPPEYGHRFFAFMKAIMRGGEGGARFKEKDSNSKEKEPEQTDGEGEMQEIQREDLNGIGHNGVNGSVDWDEKRER